MTTEARALANILGWSADSPGWQRDALRRLATQAALEPAEIDELASICKGENPAVPLEAEHAVKSIAATLRDTWEIAVEEAVGHVIRRLSNEVKTPGLVKLTAITVPDCEAMRDGFGRCSELLHSAAAALNRPLPRPEALTAGIDALAAWADSLRQRQGAAKLP